LPVCASASRILTSVGPQLVVRAFFELHFRQLPDGEAVFAASG